MHCSLRFWAILPLIFGSLFSFSVLDGPALAKAPQSSRPDEVELFSAMKSGDIEVKVFLKDASGGTAVIKNNASRPLSIKLPNAFGAAPIAAQFFGPGGGAGAGNGINVAGLGAGLGAGNGAGGGNQAVGGVFNGGGANNNGRNGGLQAPGGFFNIEAGKERKMKLASVCLEHGKDEPNPRLVYEIRPIDSITDKAEVAELVRTLAQPEVDQHSVQAAAWHLANGLPWKQLAQMPKIRHLNGLAERYFSAEQLELAQQYAATATKLAATKSKTNSSVAQSPGVCLD